MSHVTCHMSHVTCHMSNSIIIIPKLLEIGTWNFETMFTTPYVSCVTFHVLYAMCHVSQITCHTSYVIFFLPEIFVELVTTLEVLLSTEITQSSLRKDLWKRSAIYMKSTSVFEWNTRFNLRICYKTCKERKFMIIPYWRPIASIWRHTQSKTEFKGQETVKVKMMQS
jgi:hypothetical protein